MNPKISLLISVLIAGTLPAGVSADDDGIRGPEICGYLMDVRPKPQGVEITRGDFDIPSEIGHITNCRSPGFMAMSGDSRVTLGKGGQNRITIKISNESMGIIGPGIAARKKKVAALRKAISGLDGRNPQIGVLIARFNGDERREAWFNERTFPAWFPDRQDLEEKVSNWVSQPGQAAIDRIVAAKPDDQAALAQGHAATFQTAQDMAAALGAGARDPGAPPSGSPVAATGAPRDEAALAAQRARPRSQLPGTLSAGIRPTPSPATETERRLKEAKRDQVLAVAGMALGAAAMVVGAAGTAGTLGAIAAGTAGAVTVLTATPVLILAGGFFCLTVAGMAFLENRGRKKELQKAADEERRRRPGA